MVRDSPAGSWLKPGRGKASRRGRIRWLGGHSTRRRTPGLVETKTRKRPVCVWNGGRGCVSVRVPTRQLWEPAPHPPAPDRGLQNVAGARRPCPRGTPWHPSSTIFATNPILSQIFKNFIPCPFYHLTLSSRRVTPTLLLRCNRRIETARSSPRECQIVPPASF